MIQMDTGLNSPQEDNQEQNDKILLEVLEADLVLGSHLWWGSGDANDYYSGYHLPSIENLDLDARVFVIR